MTKNGVKSIKDRKFWRIHAELKQKSQYLCGVSGGTVEMKKARLGHWHNKENSSLQIETAVEMKKARLGHWHIGGYCIKWRVFSSVEMKKARLGHWHEQ